MKKYGFLTSIFFWVTTCTIFAAHVDTVLTYSSSMKKEIPAVVITPDSYNKQTNYPVLYLLHGHGGNYADWVNKTDAKTISDQYNFIIVCPDGNISSWYFDSPMDSTSRYETYVAQELVEWIDRNYSTDAKREARAITGLSMGGHGALYLAFKHQDTFGACGSMSGGVDISPFPNNWGIKNQLGEQSVHPHNWEKNTIVGMLHLLSPGSLEITIDCGVDDFFYEMNLLLHNKLTYRNIPHTFISRPGVHNWEFWKTSLTYHALFFADFFNQTR